MAVGEQFMVIPKETPAKFEATMQFGKLGNAISLILKVSMSFSFASEASAVKSIVTGPIPSS